MKMELKRYTGKHIFLDSENLGNYEFFLHIDGSDSQNILFFDQKNFMETLVRC